MKKVTIIKDYIVCGNTILENGDEITCGGHKYKIIDINESVNGKILNLRSNESGCVCSKMMYDPKMMYNPNKIRVTFS